VDLDALAASPIVAVLAVVGGVGLAYRLVRALLRLGLVAVEGTMLAGLTEVSARQGDLTGMAERRVQTQRLRRARLRAGGFVLLWGALLAVPPLAGVAALVYAAAAPLWLLPRERIRPTLLQPPPPQQ
jgi:hypothetical protein